MGRAGFKMSTRSAMSTAMAALFLISLFSCRTIAQVERDYGDYSSYQYDPVELLDLNDRALSGYFLKIEGDSMHLWMNEKDTALALADLKIVTFPKKPSQGKGALKGAITGALISLLFNYKYRITAGSFINQWDNYGTALLATSLASGAGALLGYLSDLIKGDKSERYTLRGPGDIEKMRKELMSPVFPFRLNLYIHPAHVFSAFDHGGFHTKMRPDPTRNLNFARSVTLTGSISERVEIGLSYKDASEPNITYTAQSGGVNLDYKIDDIITGLYITGSYDLLPPGGTNRFSLSPVAGIGLVKIDYSVNAGMLNTTIETINKYELSLFGAIEFRYNPFSSLSLGVLMDYIYIPGRAPASVVFNESERPFSNYSLGMSFGFHF